MSDILNAFVKDLRNIETRFIFQGSSQYAVGIAEEIESLRQRVEELEKQLAWNTCGEAEEQRNRLQAELAALKQGQGEPVAEVVECDFFTDGVLKMFRDLQHIPIGSKLYLSAPTIPEGWQLVPTEPDWENDIQSLKMLERVHKGGLCFGTDPIPDLVEKALSHWKHILAAAPKPEE